MPQEGDAGAVLHPPHAPFRLVFTPSVPPLWYGRVTAACTASLSRSRPRVEACRWAGRSRGRRQSIPQGVRGCPGAGSRPLTSFQGNQHHLRPQGRADQGWLAEQERRDHGLPGTRARAENAAFPAGPVLAGHPPCHFPDAQRIRPLRSRRRQRRSPCHLLARCLGPVYPGKTGPRAVVKVRAP